MQFSRSFAAVSPNRRILQVARRRTLATESRGTHEDSCDQDRSGQSAMAT